MSLMIPYLSIRPQSLSLHKNCLHGVSACSACPLPAPTILASGCRTFLLGSMRHFVYHESLQVQPQLFAPESRHFQKVTHHNAPNASLGHTCAMAFPLHYSHVDI